MIRKRELSRTFNTPLTGYNIRGIFINHSKTYHVVSKEGSIIKMKEYTYRSIVYVSKKDLFIYLRSGVTGRMGRRDKER